MQVRQKSSMHEVLISLLDCARLPSPAVMPASLWKGVMQDWGPAGFVGFLSQTFLSVTNLFGRLSLFHMIWQTL